MNFACILCLALTALAPQVVEHPRGVKAEEAYTRGSEAAKAGRLDEALKELDRAAALAPGDPKVHNLTGLVFTRLGRYEEAEAAYNRALKLAPSFVPARKNRAVNYFSRRDFAAASSEFEALTRLVPNDFVPRLFLGLLALEEGNFETALLRLQEAEKRAPGKSQVLIPLTRAYFLAGQREAALSTFRNLNLESAECNDSERFELGVLLAEFGENSEAERIFADLSSRNVRPYDSAFNLALLRYRAGQNEDALGTIEDKLSRGTPTGEVLSLQAWIYNRMGRLELARQSLEQAIATDPDAVEHYLDLSMVHVRRGDYLAGLEVLSRAVERGIKGGQLEVQIGLVNQAAGRNPVAEKQYRRTIELYPRYVAAYMALASLLLTTGRSGEAVRLLARAAGALPRQALIQRTYGALLLGRAESSHPEELEEAGQILQRAQQLDPRNAETAFALGKYFALRKDDHSAEKYFRQACSLNPRHVESYYRLSRLARQGGELEKAAELGRIVEKLRADQRAEEKEQFARLVEESVRGERGRAIKGAGQN